MKDNYKAFSYFLNERSEIIYLAPIIPVTLALIISLATAAIYNLDGANYLACKNFAPADEWLDRYLSGTIIINYIFVLIYCNILMEFVAPLANIISSFVLLMLFALISIIWNALGIYWLQNSKCSTTKYFVVSQTNIIIGFCNVFIYFTLTLLKIILARNQKIQPVEEKNIDSNEVKEKKSLEKNANENLEHSNTDDVKNEEILEITTNGKKNEELQKENKKSNNELDDLLDELDLGDNNDKIKNYNLNKNQNYIVKKNQNENLDKNQNYNIINKNQKVTNEIKKEEIRQGEIKKNEIKKEQKKEINKDEDEEEEDQVEDEDKEEEEKEYEQEKEEEEEEEEEVEENEEEKEEEKEEEFNKK